MTEIEVLISEHEIKGKVTELAAILEEEYQDKHPLLIGILKGSFVFMADLIRSMGIPVEIDFVQLSSYGAARESSGKIKVGHRLKTPIKGREVLVVEDIVDTGLTIRFLLNYLKRKRPESLKLCALFDKPSRRVVDVPIDYLGFTIPDAFVVGYGLDWNERFRYLRDLCIVSEEVK